MPPPDPNSIPEYARGLPDWFMNVFAPRAIPVPPLPQAIPVPTPPTAQPPAGDRATRLQQRIRDSNGRILPPPQAIPVPDPPIAQRVPDPPTAKQLGRGEVAKMIAERLASVGKRIPGPIGQLARLILRLKNLSVPGLVAFLIEEAIRLEIGRQAKEIILENLKKAKEGGLIYGFEMTNGYRSALEAAGLLRPGQGVSGNPLNRGPAYSLEDEQRIVKAIQDFIESFSVPQELEHLEKAKEIMIGALEFKDP
jgi:hypothetical protein